jgi:hypothetical protein
MAPRLESAILLFGWAPSRAATLQISPNGVPDTDTVEQFG